jgi:hypothetical protein
VAERHEGVAVTPSEAFTQTPQIQATLVVGELIERVAFAPAVDDDDG